MIEGKLRSRVKALEEEVASKTQTIQKYQSLGSAADEKIQALSKIHNDKIRSLMNSIQLLKKDNAQLNNQGKEHKRSQLIANLNKQIDDQDIVIEVIRNYVYKKEGKDQGRSHLDGLIVTALTKGPQRIRAPTREELKMEIDKLKTRLQQVKLGSGKQVEQENAGNDVLNQSEMSSITVENDRQELFKTLQFLKTDNEKLKLQLKSSSKTVDTLASQLKNNGKLQIQISGLGNQLSVANRKVETLESILKQTKEYNNGKIMELYQREIKVEELELQSKQTSNKLVQIQQAHGMAVDQLKIDIERLNVELEAMGKENERLIVENIGTKKTQDGLKEKIEQVRTLNSKQKSELGDKLTKYQKEFQRLVIDNDSKNQKIINLTALLSAEKASSLKERVEMNKHIEEIKDLGVANQQLQALIQRNSQLQQEIQRLKQVGGEGVGIPSTLLMDRLKTLERRISILQKQLKDGGQLSDKEIQALHDESLINKYLELARQFETYKLMNKNPKAKKVIEKIQLDQKDVNRWRNMDSSISDLDLKSINTQKLRDFDSDFDFEIVAKKGVVKGGLPVISEYDKGLMKLITSDIWDFIQEDKIGRMLDDMGESFNSDYDVEVLSEYPEEAWDNNFKQLQDLGKKMRKGIKVKVYAEEFSKIDDINSDVSDVKSVRQRDLQKGYDSDIQIETLRLNLQPITDKTKTPLNFDSNDLARIGDISSNISGSIQNLSVSQPESGESNINVYKRRQGSKDRRKDKTSLLIDRLDKFGDSDYEGQEALKRKIGLDASLNSSINSNLKVNESALGLVSSDLSFGTNRRK